MGVTARQQFTNHDKRWPCSLLAADSCNWPPAWRLIGDLQAIGRPLQRGGNIQPDRANACVQPASVERADSRDGAVEPVNTNLRGPFVAPSAAPNHIRIAGAGARSGPGASHEHLPSLCEVA
jgi:hypothetical protein